MTPRAQIRVLSMACVLLGGPLVSGQRTGELSGISGVPVEGHDIVAGVEIRGTKQIDLSPSGGERLRERLRENGAELRLGWPLERQVLCRFKEVLKDVLSEKGFLDAEITNDERPTFGNPQHLTIRFTVVEGTRSHPISKTAARPSPSQRCLR